jgi:serine/threonine protein kinase
MSPGPGSRLNDYELIRLLGAGGMGEVWLATDLSLQRPVALKLLPNALTIDASRVVRFEREARAASALNHPNVCTIHALGRTNDGRHFIAMEYVEGVTLRDRMVHGGLTRHESLDLAVQVASALTAAHAAGIVHRDVKPENVMLRPDGIVKVLDFGLAKLLASDSSPAMTTQIATQNMSGAIVGTVRYMSPEQARGAPVDARTDIWALGVVLYEILARRPPFAAQSTSEVLAAILEHEAEPLSRVDPTMPVELSRIVDKALRKDPERRYQVMKDMSLDLQALRDGPREQWSLARSVRNAAVIAIAATLAAGIWWARHERRPSIPVQTTAPTPLDRPLTRVTFDAGLQTDAAFSPNGRSIAYASDRAGNFDIWVQALDGGEPQQITRSPAQDTQPRWSPDGDRLVYHSVGDAEGLFIVPVRGGVERQLTSFGANPFWSSDGSEILFQTGIGPSTKIFAVSANGGEPPRELLADFLRDGFWLAVAPHPDGRLSILGTHAKTRYGFYTVSRDGTRIVSSTSGATLPLAPESANLLTQGTRIDRFQWNQSGTALYVEASVNEVRNIWRVSVDPTTLAWMAVERLTTGAGSDASAAVSRDGKRLLYTVERSSRRLWSVPLDASTGRITGTPTAITPEGETVFNPALSPDGRVVSYNVSRPGSPDVDLLTTEIDSGKTEVFARNADGGVWSRDGATLAYSLLRKDRTGTSEVALAVRKRGGPERIVGHWTTGERFGPTDWRRSGEALLGSYFSIPTKKARLALWPLEAAGPTQFPLASREAWLWQAHFSPNERWISFVEHRVNSEQSPQVRVAAAGAPPSEWIHIAPDHGWTDKPRWAPDGKTLYFLSRHGSPFVNLWAQRFDPERGTPIGEPFVVTRFDSPGLTIAGGSSDEIDIAARRALLSLVSVGGNIWMLENVDK